jgi:uncharacterized protein YbjT (DUF2867 family)
MASPILVMGGTGTLGRLVVRRLERAGRNVRVLSRHGGGLAGVEVVKGDLTSGLGIEAAVSGVETVVHCAGTNKGDAEKAAALAQAATRSGVRHLVFISVVGADRIPGEAAVDRMLFGYFASKLGAERVVAQSGIPWTTLRATQFYDLVLKAAAHMTRLPIVPVPAGFRFQPVDADDVASRLVELALGAPAGRVPDLAGPRVYSMSELVRTYLAAVGKHRLIAPIWLPGQAARAVRRGAALAPDGAVGRRTWEDFLTARVRGSSAPGALEIGSRSAAPSPGS